VGVTEIVLSAEEGICLSEGGYTKREINGQTWRIAHESYDRPFPRPADRHVSLSAAEVDLIVRTPEGLVEGDLTIRMEVAR
jgi:hypothetical protein